jgi:hypothetical protein
MDESLVHKSIAESEADSLERHFHTQTSNQSRSGADDVIDVSFFIFALCHLLDRQALLPWISSISTHTTSTRPFQTRNASFRPRSIQFRRLSQVCTISFGYRLTIYYCLQVTKVVRSLTSSSPPLSPSQQLADSARFEQDPSLISSLMLTMSIALRTLFGA